jgi:Ca2+-binding EF-hand superfamily protein
MDAFFRKFARNGVIDRKLFNVLLSTIKPYVAEIHDIDVERDVDIIDAVFELVGKGKDIDKESFRDWWTSTIKFSYFKVPKSDLITKSYRMFTAYSSSGRINLDGFIRMLKDLNINGSEEDFKDIDIDKDGSLDFSELCKWLNWF